MKIEPRHDYKKPLYAVGMTAILGATMLMGTGCGDKVKTSLEVRSGHSKEVELGGATTIIEGDIAEPDIDYAGEEDVCPDDDVELAGETAPEDDLELSGDVEIAEG